MSRNILRRRWGSDLELLDAMPGGRVVGVRDFALITLAGQLAETFPGQLIFKGGFVLRHAHGHMRFSKDVDATRHSPPAHKFEAADVAGAIREASIHNVVQFDPGAPATDSARSLDFDNVTITGELLPSGSVQVEVSYREGISGTPIPVDVGAPFYESFEILTMEPAEMAAEKLRTLAQRDRETDLADLAVLLRDNTDDARVAEFAESKFELVRQGAANRLERIDGRIQSFAATYNDVVPQLFLNAPTYDEAVAIVRPRLKRLVPSG